jgi:serine-type D-Ala-D-Ala carboxypeptidase (penicillin-binding protein 5/6)
VIKRRVSAILAFTVSSFWLVTAQAAPTIDTIAQQAIVVDADTETVLLSKNAYEPMYPASMTKMMTAHIIFDYLKSGKLKMEDTLSVSEEAWRKGGSKMFVKVNTRVSIEDLLKGIVIQSGNDACIVVAEGISGTEAQFAELMNVYAKELGMTKSHFKNATGWPDDEHVTSPYDLYLLAKDTIENYPEYYPIYSQDSFTYSGITQPNRNLLLDNSIGVDGLKTGHTEAAGYGITISGVNPEDGRRIIVVVNGLSSEKERADEAERLLIFAYRNFENKTVWQQGAEVAKGDVWFGEAATVPLVAAEDVTLTLPKGDYKDITMTVKYNGPIAAPVAKGQEVGQVVVSVPGREPQAVKLVTGADVPKLSGASRIVPALKHYLAP